MRVEASTTRLTIAERGRWTEFWLDFWENASIVQCYLMFDMQKKWRKVDQRNGDR